VFCFWDGSRYTFPPPWALFPKLPVLVWALKNTIWPHDKHFFILFPSCTQSIKYCQIAKWYNICCSNFFNLFLPNLQLASQTNAITTVNNPAQNNPSVSLIHSFWQNSVNSPHLRNCFWRIMFSAWDFQLEIFSLEWPTVAKSNLLS